MLNKLWGFMILIGLSFGIITGEVEALSNAAIDSAGEAVSLAITMLGIMALWTGLIEIARRSGLLDILTRKLAPVLRFLFPRIPEGHRVNEYIAANIIANILGLGWAATPMGLKSMKEFAALERERTGNEKVSKASDEMCTFLVINISSLQLIPVNVIAYRSQYGSTNPAAVVLPGLLATIVSTVVAVVFCRIMCKKGEKENISGNCKKIEKKL
ncbi:MAG: nucleoside recognition protein [Lachnospiraceae bacterium]|nr:nucleoside recognition protein [Lachnospiraceae bacterium]